MYTFKKPHDLYISATIESLLAGSPLTAYFILTEGQIQFASSAKPNQPVKDEPQKMEVDDNWGAPEELVEESLELDWGDSDEDEETDEISMEINQPSKTDLNPPEELPESPTQDTPKLSFLTHHIQRSLALLTFSYKKGHTDIDLNHLTREIQQFVQRIGDSNWRQWIYFLRFNLSHRNGAYNTALSLALDNDSSPQMPLIKERFFIMYS